MTPESSSGNKEKISQSDDNNNCTYNNNNNNVRTLSSEGSNNNGSCVSDDLPAEWIEVILEKYNKEQLKLKKLFPFVNSMKDFRLQQQNLRKNSRAVYYFIKKWQIFENIDDLLFFYFMVFYEYESVFLDIWKDQITLYELYKTDNEKKSLITYFHDKSKALKRLNLLDHKSVKHEKLAIHHLYSVLWANEKLIKKRIKEIQNKKWGFPKKLEEKIPLTEEELLKVKIKHLKVNKKAKQILKPKTDIGYDNKCDVCQVEFKSDKLEFLCEKHQK